MWKKEKSKRFYLQAYPQLVEWKYWILDTLWACLYHELLITYSKNDQPHNTTLQHCNHNKI